MLLVSFVIAMLATMALIPLLMRASERFGMLDQPGPRKMHSRPIPRVGGLAMVVGVLIPLVGLDALPRAILAIVAGVLVVVAVGAWDDRRTLGYKEKFVGQLAAAIIVVVGGGIRVEHLVLFDPISLPLAASIPLTVFVLVALTNAVNLADGLDGLAGGTTFLCCSALGVLAYASGNVPALVLALSTSGAILGFLRFNTHPASVFMGDGGSQFLGLTVASLAILVTQQETAVVSATTPLFLLAVPIFDTAFVMGRRISEGRSPFLADKNHLHHRLLSLGLTHHEAVTCIYAIQATLFVVAYRLRFETDLANLAVFVGIGVALLGAIVYAERFGWRLSRTTDPSTGAGFDFFAKHIGLPSLSTHLALLMQLLLAGYCLLGSLALDVPRDIGALSGLLLAGWGLALLPGLNRYLDTVEKGVSYVLAAVLAYLVTQVGWVLAVPHGVESGLIGLLAVATAATLRYSRTGRFELSSMDLLVLFTAVVVPSLPGAILGNVNVPPLAARVVVLFYSIEVVFHTSADGRRTYRVALLTSLAVMTLRTLV